MDRKRATAWLIEERTGKQHQLFQGNTTIGRAPNNDIVIINDETVSREHAMIRNTQSNSFVLIPQKNITPLKINGVVADTQMQLTNGDRILIGKTSFRFTS